MAGNGKRRYHFQPMSAVRIGSRVNLSGWVSSPEDRNRPLVSSITAGKARDLAAQLLRAAEEIDGIEIHSPVTEPAQPSGRLAELLGMIQGETQ